MGMKDMIEVDKLLDSLRHKELKVELEPKIEAYKIMEEYSEKFLFENIKTYEDVCQYLEESREGDPYLQIKQIARLFNGSWKPKFDGEQENYFPSFDGLLQNEFKFDYTIKDIVDFYGAIIYYKTEEISDFVGKTFADIYQKLSKLY